MNEGAIAENLAANIAPIIVESVYDSVKSKLPTPVQNKMPKDLKR